MSRTDLLRLKTQKQATGVQVCGQPLPTRRAAHRHQRDHGCRGAPQGESGLSPHRSPAQGSCAGGRAAGRAGRARGPWEQTASDPVPRMHTRCRTTPQLSPVSSRCLLLPAPRRPHF